MIPAEGSEPRAAGDMTEMATDADIIWDGDLLAEGKVAHELLRARLHARLLHEVAERKRLEAENAELRDAIDSQWHAWNSMNSHRTRNDGKEVVREQMRVLATKLNERQGGA